MRKLMNNCFCCWVQKGARAPLILSEVPERKASVTIYLSIRPKHVSHKATFKAPMTPFQVLMQSICNYKVVHRMFIRVFPVMLCFFSSLALADATSDIESLIENKQWAQAQRLIQTELDRKTTTAQSPQWRLMQSQVMAGMGKNQEAINALQLLIQEFPELPEPYNNLGVLLAAQGQYESAAEAFLAAIQARPNYKIAFQNLGDLYAAMAKQAYEKAKTLNDNKSVLPPPKPAASSTTTTNTRTLR
jgi:tetratricopeptide (TPR) repeat protein